MGSRIGDPPVSVRIQNSPDVASDRSRNATPVGRDPWEARDAAMAVATPPVAGLALPPPLVVAPPIPAPTTPPANSVLPAKLPDDDNPNVKTLRKVFDGIPVNAGVADVELLEDGPASWNKRWRVLETADGQIDTTYYIVERDIFGFAYLGHLLKKAREGVDVRLMIDAAGSSAGLTGFTWPVLGQDYLQELVETKHADVRIYNPVAKSVLRQLPKGLGDIAELARNHDKALTTRNRDGSSTSLLGGRNIKANYYPRLADKPGVFIDSDLSATAAAGPGSAIQEALKQGYDCEFTLPTNKIIGPEVLGNWTPRDIELIGAYLLMDIWIKEQPLDDGETAKLRQNAEFRELHADRLVQAALKRLPAEGIKGRAVEWQETKLRELALELVSYPTLRGSYYTAQPPTEPIRAEVKAVDRASRAAGGADSLTPALLDTLSMADHPIIIENPYVMMPPMFISALKNAAAKGTPIWLLTPSPESTDSMLSQVVFMQDWPQLLVDVPTLRIFVITAGGVLHAKKVATGPLVFVGSANLDPLSAFLNSENGFVLWSSGLAETARHSTLSRINDPANGVVEYRIKRDSQGAPVLVDGKPVVEFGPRDHMTEQQWQDFLQVAPWADRVRDTEFYKNAMDPSRVLTEPVGVKP